MKCENKLPYWHCEADATAVKDTTLNIKFPLILSISHFLSLLRLSEVISLFFCCSLPFSFSKM